jgi:hypothetical protein
VIWIFFWANWHDSNVVTQCARFEEVYIQNQKMFICDFVIHVKLCQVEIHNMYCDDEKKYSHNDLSHFENFDVIHIVWWNNGQIDF